jgi:hypothetical protein
MKVTMQSRLVSRILTVAVAYLGLSLATGCSNDPTDDPEDDCWAQFFLWWECDSVGHQGWVTQGVTFTVPPGAFIQEGSGVHWEGPETIEPTFLVHGPDEDGTLVATYPIFGLSKFIGEWTAHVVLGLGCREEAFVEDFPFLVVWESPPPRPARVPGSLAPPAPSWASADARSEFFLYRPSALDRVQL